MSIKKYAGYRCPIQKLEGKQIIRCSFNDLVQTWYKFESLRFEVAGPFKTNRIIPAYPFTFV